MHHKDDHIAMKRTYEGSVYDHCCERNQTAICKLITIQKIIYEDYNSRKTDIVYHINLYKKHLCQKKKNKVI